MLNQADPRLDVVPREARGGDDEDRHREQAESHSSGQAASEFLGGVSRMRLTELRHGSDHRERDC